MGWLYLMRSNMDITSADVYRLEVPMHTSYRAAVHDFSTMDAVLIVLTTSNGMKGIGTVDPSPGYSRQTPSEIKQGLSKILPRFVTDCPENPNKLTQFFRTINGEKNVKCGIEMAYLDLYCRRREISLQEFLGGPLREVEPLNGWVGIADPKTMVENAIEYEKNGFDSIKLKLDGDSETDIERVQAVCDAVGEQMQIRADVNGAYDVPTAIHVAQSLEEYPLEHLEQPVPLDDIKGLKKVTNSTSITIMADECLLSIEDIYKVLSQKVADRIKVKILRLGGIFPTRQALDTASSAGVSCVVGHGFGLSPSASAELQLTSSHDNVVTPVESVGPLKMKSEPFSPLLSVKDGRAIIPDDSGLGVQVVESELSKYTTDSERYS